MINFTLPQGRLPRIAVLGAGHVGPIIARLAVEAGYQVAIAGSGDPAQIELIVQVLAPGAEPRWAADAVREADIVVSAIPLHAFPKLDPSGLSGKLVLDVMNYWAPTDGVQETFEDHRSSSSEIVQRRLVNSTVVKTLNHLGYKRNAGQLALRTAAHSEWLATIHTRWTRWPNSSGASATTRYASTV